MSWRDILGISSGTLAQNPHNTHTPIDVVNSADCADIARGEEDQISREAEVLSQACAGVEDTSPKELRDVLEEEGCDILFLSEATVRSLAKMLAERRQMDRGDKPERFFHVAECEGCGPVWAGVTGSFKACPWCTNRRHHRPIPRPSLIRCHQCVNYQKTDHPFMGHCSEGEPEAIAGLCGSDPRYCDWYLPLTQANVRLLDERPPRCGTPQEIEVIRPEPSARWFLSQGIEVALGNPGDLEYLEAHLPAGDGEREELLLGYCRVWQNAMDDESASHQRQNAGRRAANTWLRQKRCS